MFANNISLITPKKPYLNCKVAKKNFIKVLENHVKKRRNNNNYDVKLLLLSSAGLDLYANLVDAVNFKNNKEVPKAKRNYTASYKVMNGIVSSVAQLVSGLLVLNPKTQKFMADKLFKGMNQKSADYAKALKGLRAFSTIVISTVLVKRLLSPILIVPLAGALNRFTNKKNNKFQNIFNQKYAKGNKNISRKLQFALDEMQNKKMVTYIA